LRHGVEYQITFYTVRFETYYYLFTTTVWSLKFNMLLVTYFGLMHTFWYTRL